MINIDLVELCQINIQEHHILVLTFGCVYLMFAIGINSKLKQGHNCPCTF